MADTVTARPAETAGDEAGATATATANGALPRLRQRYADEIVPALVEEHGHRNVMQVPRVTKVVVSMGVGAGKEDEKLVQAAADDLGRITGQRPKLTRSTRAISNFRLRQNMLVGCFVTLRGRRMWEFLDRLISVALPRIRDFRGLNPRSFDGHGNYSLGLNEQTLFPEIDPDRVQRAQGMNITIVTTATTDAEAQALLRKLGLPLRES